MSFGALITFYSLMFGIDPDLSRAIIQVESNGGVNKVGTVGEIGLMQLNPKYFDADRVKKPEENIKQGIKYLSYVKKHCKLKDDTWVICYNLGLSGAKKIKNPKQFEYYLKVKKAYKENNVLVVRYH